MANIKKIEEELPQRINEYIHEKGSSQRKIAQKAGLRGINEGTVSRMSNGDFKSISDEKKLSVWNVVKPASGVVYNTNDTMSGIQACNNARKHHRMIAIEADTGMSKTTILETVSKSKNTAYMYIDGTVTPGNFLKQLLRELGVSFEGSQNDMLLRVAHELNTQKNPLLLIDECAKIKDNIMLILHSLRDRTKDNCGIVLAGMPAFRARLIKFSKKGKTGYAEFYRRIQIWHELNGLSTEEVKYILSENDIAPDTDNGRYLRYRTIGELSNQIELYKEINS